MGSTSSIGLVSYSNVSFLRQGHGTDIGGGGIIRSNLHKVENIDALAQFILKSNVSIITKTCHSSRLKGQHKYSNPLILP